MPSHQVKSVPIYTGHEGSNICIDDWIRDTKYLIGSTSMATHMQFGTIVRYLSGAVRKLVLNLPVSGSKDDCRRHNLYTKISIFR